jgi:spore coat protein CotH
MREKLSSDLLYKMGVKTTSTNYANIIVNGEDIGLFVLTNKIKKDLIKKYFNDKTINDLYECKLDYARFEDNSIIEHCNNIKDELVDDKDDLQNLVDAVNNAKSVDDIKDLIDIDAVLTTFAFEFVTLSWDHFFILGHNYFWYKNPQSGKWMMILNDFDETFCQDIWSNYFTDDSRYISKPYIPNLEYLNLPNLAVRDMDSGHKLVKLLIYDDDTRWREILGEVVKKAFNPSVLFPRI